MSRWKWLVTVVVAATLAAVLGGGRPAAADTLGYPWPSAPCGTVGACNGSTGTLGWYWDENGDGHLTGNHCDAGAPSGECYDPYGYEYDNCTSYVAWKLASLGVPTGYITGLGNGGQWYDRAANKSGLGRGTTPAVGAAAVVPATYNTDGSIKTFGHVAYVSQVSYRADGSVDPGGNITVLEYNRNYDGVGGTGTGTAANMHFTEFVYFGPLMTSPPSGGAPPAPGAIAALRHGSRVDLSWGPSSGATSYQVTRNGTAIATTSATTLLDVTVSPGQDYAYAVTAINSSGSSAPTTRYVQTAAESGDRAYLRTKDGPAACGRTGDASSQRVDCTVLTASGWMTVSSVAHDWGYSPDRTWLTNADGTVSYCRRVNYGDQAACDRFDGTTWTYSTSPRTDLGYDADRAYLSTKDGPAVCGRTGDQSSQSVDCTVLKSTGWVTVYSPAFDWGYPNDRTWLTNADGTVSYCRRVNYGDQAACDRFDGTTWTSSTSPRTDLGYDADRAYLSTKDGPAVCGRTGDATTQSIDCTVLTASGWSTVYSTGYDWGYANDRTWLTNADGTVSYCRRVNYGDQVACDRFDGTAWTRSVSPRTDLAYAENRSYLATKDGPAVCGRTGDASSQSIDCTVLTASGWSTVYSPAHDWGYATDRGWLVNADGTVSYCRRVNYGDQAACDRFDGTAWTYSTSPRTDLGYPDTF